jgi:hypothetical protein
MQIVSQYLFRYELIIPPTFVFIKKEKLCYKTIVIFLIKSILI